MSLVVNTSVTSLQYHNQVTVTHRIESKRSVVKIEYRRNFC